jgi:FKBP-type peptidyl-prolyl cis-trans isomerase SlyD
VSQDIISKQKVVTFTYSIIDNDTGEVLEQSGMPMSYLHGVDGKMYPQAELALDGKKVDDTVEVVLPPEQGFGYPDPEMIYVDKIENVPPEYRHIGAEAMFHDDQGDEIAMKVTKIEKGVITLDANHPFAGKTVKFKITVLALRDPTELEIGTGEVVDMSGPQTIQ